MVNPKITENFGPWMLAKRKIHKAPTSLQISVGKDSHGKGKETVKVGLDPTHGEGRSFIRKSKFAVLEMEGEENMVEDLNGNVNGSFDNHESNVNGSFDNPASNNSFKRKGPRGGKNRHDTMQVLDPPPSHAKYTILEGTTSHMARTEAVTEGIIMDLRNKLRERKMGPNQAPAEDSHWVVAGSPKTNVISRERMVHDLPYQPSLADLSGRHMQSDEHHQDPPSDADSDSSEEDSVEEMGSEDDVRILIPRSPHAMCTDEEVAIIILLHK